MAKDPFQAYSEEYDNWYDRNLDTYLLEMAALKEVIPSSGRGLELGVGTGRFAGPLGVEWGVDRGRVMLKKAAVRGVRVIQGEGEALPFGSQNFNYVIMVTVVCFLSDPGAVMAEIYRVLEKKGKLIIGFVDRESRLGRCYQAKKQKSLFYKEAKFYSTSEVLDFLSSGGWKVISFRQTLFNIPGKKFGARVIKKGYGKGGFVVVSAEKV